MHPRKKPQYVKAAPVVRLAARAAQAGGAPSGTAGRAKMRHRAIFLSDLHLGSRMCRSGRILDFIDTNEADTVFLVGDIFDNWRPLSRHWTQEQHTVVRRLMQLAQSGTRVVYIPGNHDAFFRAFSGVDFGGIEVMLDAVHQTGDGRRFLVVHGDQCDVFSRRAPIMARAGSFLESAVRDVDGLQKSLCSALGLGKWGGIERLIARTNAAIRKHDRFEERLCDLARGCGVDGVICGHFHQPALHDRHGLLYANCGDWAENETAIVETSTGQLDLIVLGEQSARRSATPDSRMWQAIGPDQRECDSLS